MKTALTTDWKLALFIVILASPLLLFSQPLEVNNAPPITPDNLITNIFLGEGVEVLNVQFQGSSASVGFFQNGQDEVGLDRGIVMSTGFAVSAPGQIGVDASGSVQSSEGASGVASDPDMEALANTADLQDLVFDANGSITIYRQSIPVNPGDHLLFGRSSNADCFGRVPDLVFVPTLFESGVITLRLTAQAGNR